MFFVDQKQKLQLLTHWLRETPWTRTLVFTRTKHGADKIAKSLVKSGIQADAFHSNKSQSARQRVLLRFKAPQPLVLVATDIAARGLDIDDVSHVVNFDLPIDADNYIHRIGRTGRAGAAGVAVSFCDHGERSSLAGDPTPHAANAGRRGAPGGHARRGRQGVAFRHENGARQADRPRHRRGPTMASDFRARVAGHVRRRRLA